MKPSKIEHIGIAVKNLDKSILLYEKMLGYKCYKIEEVKDQKVRTAFFKIGETKIELLEATDPTSPIARFIEKRGEGMHHLAFAVSDIEERLQEIEKTGINLIDKKTRKGADGLDIAFLHPGSTSGVLIELCENKNKD
ncbi:MAG: methylmalonyl-CoA epimerase [Bacteroidota bacterium]|nr:methylmalonyl-CoA epimerase [Bacteroidota bacterium]